MNRKFPYRIAALSALAPIALALGGSFGLASNASAQFYGPGSSSLNTFATLSAGNLNADPGAGFIPVLPFAQDYSPVGGFVTASGSHSFTGKDSHGVTQTMTLSGTAQTKAEYGVLHAYAQATLVNPYYNAVNNPYYTGDGPRGVRDPNGSPQYFQVAGQATFEDTLTLNPVTDGIVTLRYHFHLDGNVVDSGHSYSYFAYSAGANSTTFFTDPSFNNSVDWTTPDWNVTPGSPIALSGNFGAVFLVNVSPDFTTEGETISGTSDFYNTLKLIGIDLLDSHGNIVNGASYLTASGTHYNIAGATYGPSAVPEPGATALLAGMGVAGVGLFASRRRRK